MKLKIKNYFEKNYKKISILLGCFVWFIAHLGLLSQNKVFSHDTLSWYGIFHYFAESLMSGFFPFWNPYIHGGEIFFENFSQLNVIDPVNLLGIIFGKVFAVSDLFYLYTLIVLAKLIVLAAGVQLFLNELFPGIREHWYFTFFIILLSSFSINAYHQNGAFIVLGYIPFVLYFIIRFFKYPNWINILSAAYFLGISCQSITFSYCSTFLFLFLTIYFIFFKDSFYLLKNHKLKIFCSLIIFILLAAPAWSLLFYKSDFIPYGRMIFNSAPEIFFMDYERLSRSAAAFGKWGDFLALPWVSKALDFYRDLDIEIPLSELYLYVGGIPFIFGLIGIFTQKSNYKRIFLLLLFITGCLFIGPLKYNFVYIILFYIFPPLRLLENSHEFANYFLLCFLFFISAGIIFVIDKYKNHKYILFILFFITLFEYDYYSRKVSRDRNEYTLKPAINLAEAGLDFNADFQFKLRPRIKSALPDFKDNRIIDLNGNDSYLAQYNLKRGDLKGTYDFGTENYVQRLNYLSTIKKTPSAIDFYNNYPYEFIRLRYPTSLTYPYYYYNLIKSKIPWKVKENLLGVNLEPFEFYTGFSTLNDEVILKSNDNLLNYLKNNVIISGDSNKMNTDRGPDKELNYKIEILNYRPNDIKLSVRTNKPGILLFRDGYNPRWIATVDGIKKKIERANLNSKAVFLDAGNHIVEFSFYPYVYIFALCSYVIINLVFLFVFIINFKKYWEE